MKNDVDSDFLYERERDDKDIKRMEKSSSDALKQELEPFTTVNEECFYCNLDFPTDDMDRKDGEWICKYCEEKK